MNITMILISIALFCFFFFWLGRNHRQKEMQRTHHLIPKGSSTETLAQHLVQVGMYEENPKCFASFQSPGGKRWFKELDLNGDVTYTADRNKAGLFTLSEVEDFKKKHDRTKSYWERVDIEFVDN